MFMLIIGIVFVAYGVYRGEVDTVFTKAIRVCMECIGIG
ncbi:CD1871A family CXXC motif-containing protein [Clostridium butyricum]